MRSRRSPLTCLPDHMMRLTGTDFCGNPVWVKNYRHTAGVLITGNPNEAELYRDHGTMRAAFHRITQSGCMYNVFVQFVPVGVAHESPTE